MTSSDNEHNQQPGAHELNVEHDTEKGESLQKLTFEVDAQAAGTRLDAFLAGVTEFSRTRIQKMMEEGSALLNGEPGTCKMLVHEGDRVVLNVPPVRPAHPVAQEIPVDVVFQDQDFMVINKPAGMVVHPGAGVHDGTLVNALLAMPGTVSSIGGVERPGIVHRLDKDTSGLMLVAKNDLAHQAISDMLAEHAVVRHYLGIAMRRFAIDYGVVDAPIGRHPTVRTRMAVADEEDKSARDARTHWRVLETFGNFSLIECRLETGRTHQIRVHLDHIRHPLVGDQLYGGTAELAQQLCDPRDNKLRHVLKQARRQMLHSHYLKMAHPRTGEQMEFNCPPPADFMAVLSALRAK